MGIHPPPVPPIRSPQRLHASLVVACAAAATAGDADGDSDADDAVNAVTRRFNSFEIRFTNY